jgi:hypothetical protein
VFDLHISFITLVALKPWNLAIDKLTVAPLTGEAAPVVVKTIVKKAAIGKKTGAQTEKQQPAAGPGSKKTKTAKSSSPVTKTAVKKTAAKKTL